MKMRAIGIASISVLLTAFVVGNAFYQKKQFYPSVVYITKSNSSMAVIYMQFFVCVLLLGKLFRKIFLGRLHTIEFEHLMERFWYALTETCLAFTVFRDDFNPRFVALFTVLLFIKSFHWLADQRVEFMERTPLISWIFHVRIASLIGVLGMLDYWMTMHAYHSTVERGPTVQLVFGFEYAILLTVITSIGIRYSLYAAETRADQTWENKAVFLLYTELVIGLIRVLLYIAFVVIMAKIYALPMFVFRPMFFTMRSFKKALNDVIKSRQAIRNMNTLYPDATQEELTQADNLCIICREDMVSNSKKLPCGHIFHTSCLRSWFQRQQTCPTCRLNILRPHSTALPAQTPAPGAANPAAAVPNQAPNNAVPNNVENPFGNIFNPTANGVLPGQPAGVNQANTGIPTGANVPMTSNFPFPVSAAPPPPFAFLAPFTIPPPPMPPSLDTLSDSELKALEGTERKNVEERIKLLRNIQLMLDAATILMTQYSTIAPVEIAPVTSSLSEPSTSQLKDVIPDTPPTSLSSTSQEEQQQPSSSKDFNKVTIEDIGGEEHIYSQAAGDAKEVIQGPSNSVDDSNSTTTDLNELRRRRLEKYSNETE